MKQIYIYMYQVTKSYSLSQLFARQVTTRGEEKKNSIFAARGKNMRDTRWRSLEMRHKASERPGRVTVIRHVRINGNPIVSPRSNQGIPRDLLFAGPPTILVKPQSQNVKAGGIASFYCTAEGQPPPQIHWRKNGKRISRKFALFVRDSSFFFATFNSRLRCRIVVASSRQAVKTLLFGASLARALARESCLSE